VASTLARGELERIGLPFAVALLPAAAALPGSPRRWLAAQVVVAVTVQACWRLGW
jgi:methylthioxylose transferase